MSKITHAYPIDTPSNDPQNGPHIARSGFHVVLDCGHTYTGNPAMYYPIGDYVNCSYCRAGDPVPSPEGVSILVAVPAGVTALPDEMLRQAAVELAVKEHPGMHFGRVLYVGLDDLGPQQHEVVLEVIPAA